MYTLADVECANAFWAMQRADRSMGHPGIVPQRETRLPGISYGILAATGKSCEQERLER
jgi:hypothetical protein